MFRANPVLQRVAGSASSLEIKLISPQLDLLGLGIRAGASGARLAWRTRGRFDGFVHASSSAVLLSPLIILAPPKFSKQTPPDFAFFSVSSCESRSKEKDGQNSYGKNSKCRWPWAYIRRPDAPAEVAEEVLPSHRPPVHDDGLNQNCPSEQLQSPWNRNIFQEA